MYDILQQGFWAAVGAVIGLFTVCIAFVLIYFVIAIIVEVIKTIRTQRDEE